MSCKVGLNEFCGEWLEYENTRHGFRARSSNPLATYTEFPEQYRPGSSPYSLPLFDIPSDECQLYRSHNPDADLEAKYFPPGRVQFPVHPVNLGNDQIPHIQKIAKNSFNKCTVSPTSSTRTVYVLEKPDLPPHCLKPHTDLRITRWRRHMEKRKVAHAVAVTRMLEKSNVFCKCGKLGYFPESLGAVYGKENSQKDWGFIIREMQSKPYLKQPYRMIPLNALYITPACEPGSKPLLVEMIKKSGKSPREYLLEEILFPLIRGWAMIYLETGILLEPHGQNVIVETDPETGKILRFSHRDFDCEINKDIAVQKGFSLRDLNSKDLFTTKGDDWAPQGSHLSIIFDNSMRVVFEELAELGLRNFQVPKESLRKRVREFMNKEFPHLLEAHFPRNGKKYTFLKHDSGVSVVEKTEPPDWRDIPKD